MNRLNKVFKAKVASIMVVGALVIGFSLILPSCSLPITPCASSQLLGLWYQSSQGSTLWFQDTCDIRINGCEGYSYVDHGTSFIIAIIDTYHRRCGFIPINTGLFSAEVYTIDGDELTVSGEKFKRFKGPMENQ